MRGVLALWACASLICGGSAVTQVHVDSVEGNDSNPGTAASPLASIQKAKQIVRAKRAKGLGGAVDVILHNGTYECPEPLQFSAEDGGVSFMAPTTYKAAQTARPELIGGKALKLKWTLDTVRGKNVWKAEVPEGTDQPIPALFVGGHRMWRARWPNVDLKYPTIFGGGFATATGGINSIPCSFRSPALEINNKSCALANIERKYPAQPPTGLIFPPSSASPRLQNWTVADAVVHVRTVV
jgi:hypothetical protein